MTAVRCRHANGLVLKLYSFVEGPLGIKQSVPTGASFELRNGMNEVPAEFWTAWLEANKNDGMVRNGLVAEEKQEEASR